MAEPSPGSPLGQPRGVESWSVERQVAAWAAANFTAPRGRRSIFELPSRWGIDLLYEASGPDLLGLVLRYRGQHTIYLSSALLGQALLHEMMLGHELGHALSGVVGLGMCGLPGSHVEPYEDSEFRAWGLAGILAVPASYGEAIYRGGARAQDVADELGLLSWRMPARRAWTGVLLGEWPGDPVEAEAQARLLYTDGLVVLAERVRGLPEPTLCAPDRGLDNLAIADSLRQIGQAYGQPDARPGDDLLARLGACNPG